MYYEIVKKNKSLIYRQKGRNKNMKLIICKQLIFFLFSSRPKGKNEFDNNANELFNINT